MISVPNKKYFIFEAMKGINRYKHIFKNIIGIYPMSCTWREKVESNILKEICCIGYIQKKHTISILVAIGNSPLSLRMSVFRVRQTTSMTTIWQRGILNVGGIEERQSKIMSKRSRLLLNCTQGQTIDKWIQNHDD